MTEKSPQWEQVNALVQAEFNKVRDLQVAPWGGFGHGTFKAHHHSGKPISFAGIAFSGCVTAVFWEGYIEPFLRDAVGRCIEQVSVIADKIGTPRGPLLDDALDAMVLGVRRVYTAMLQIHGTKASDDLAPDIEPKIESMLVFARSAADGWRLPINTASAQDSSTAEEDPRWRPASWFARHHLNLSTLRHATDPKRVTKKVRKTGTGKGVRYSAADAHQHWPEKIPPDG